MVHLSEKKMVPSLLSDGAHRCISERAAMLPFACKITECPTWTEAVSCRIAHAGCRVAHARMRGYRLVSCPMEVLKVRGQVLGNSKYCLPRALRTSQKLAQHSAAMRAGVPCALWRQRSAPPVSTAA